MKNYLDSLFVHLISIGNYDILLEGPPNCEELAARLKEDIEVYLGTISHESLTVIMDSFEPGYIQATWVDIGKQIDFRKNLDGLLREIVAISLAYAILTRISKNAKDQTALSLADESSQLATA